MESENIVDPIESKVFLYTDLYSRYSYLKGAWHNTSPGTDINNKEELNSFLNDVAKSENMWENTGFYLGLIYQAVEGDTVIDRSCPIGFI